MAMDSFDRPLNTGMSRRRTPFSSSTRTTFAQIASERSEPRSKSMAKASKARASSAHSGRSRPTGELRLRSGALLNSP